MALRRAASVGRARRPGTDIVRPTYPVRNPIIKFMGRGEAATRYPSTTVFFQRGWFPAGSAACLRTNGATANGLASGTQIRTQIDVHHLWPDGSVAIAIVTAEVPRLNADEALACTLEIGATHPSPGSTLVWATVASGKAVSVSMTPQGESAVTVDVLANLQADYWRQGPLVVERRCQIDTLSAPMPASTRLVADVAIYKDGEVTADISPRNDVMFAGGTSGTWTGTITASINGVQKFDSTANNWNLNRHNLNKRLTARISSAATKPPAVYTDMTVARDAGLLPSYDFTLGCNPFTTWWDSRKATVGAAWDAVYHWRAYEQYFPMTGGRADIGFVPDWHASFIVQPSAAGFDVVVDMGESGLAIPIYAYDRSTSSDVMVINSRLNRWMDGRDAGWLPAAEITAQTWQAGESIPNTLYMRKWLGLVYQATTTGTTGATPPTHTTGTASDGGVTWKYIGFDNGGWTVGDTSHKGNFCLIPFLATGRRCFLDGIMGEGAFAIYSVGPAYREKGGTVLSGGSCNIMSGIQVRSQAWAMRDAVLAWFCTPNTGPFAAAHAAFRTYLGDCITGSFTKAYADRAAVSQTYGDWAGFVVGSYGDGKSMAPWQTDYFIHGAAVRAYLLGFDIAGDYLTWMVDGFAGNRCRNNGGIWYEPNGWTYNLPIVRTADNGPCYGWAGVKAEGQARDLSLGSDTYYIESGWGYASAGNYAVLCAASFVELLPLFPSRLHLAAQLDWINTSSVPNVNGTYLRNTPKESFMPRGQTRAA